MGVSRLGEDDAERVAELHSQAEGMFEQFYKMLVSQDDDDPYGLVEALHSAKHSLRDARKAALRYSKET